MTNHPNFDRTQAVLDAVRKGDYAPAFDLYADDILMENGPGAGPWHRASGKDDMALMLAATIERFVARQGVWKDPLTPVSSGSRRPSSPR